ncbi:MAG: hypothetical protein ACOYOV_00270 [Bacteroidales bacterium]
MRQETIFLTEDQASDLVDRIADRCENFNHTMSKPEKEAMSQLLADIGVSISDLIDVSNLADNYAINAEIVSPSEVDQYSRASLRDALFTWKENGETHYCIQW